MFFIMKDPVKVCLILNSPLFFLCFPLKDRTTLRPTGNPLLKKVSIIVWDDYGVVWVVLNCLLKVTQPKATWVPLYVFDEILITISYQSILHSKL